MPWLCKKGWEVTCIREASHQISQQEFQTLQQKWFRNSLQLVWEKGQGDFQITQKGKMNEYDSMQDFAWLRMGSWKDIFFSWLSSFTWTELLNFIFQYFLQIVCQEFWHSEEFSSTTWRCWQEWQDIQDSRGIRMACHCN